jgi:tetratricopeptide (TPR) repeat protein
MPAAWACGAGLLLGLAGPASGAPAVSDDPIALAATDHASRAVLVDLRLGESPTPEDYEIAARLFSIVAELAPADAELARLETAAAFGTGDPSLLEAATARVVSLDPRDTVAQLRLITARIGRMQTAEKRLEIYERLLGPRGNALDPTIRSRLALDAALIYREAGDLDSFLRMLTRATDLDRTNKEAHHLATSYYAEYSDTDPQGLAGLLEMQLRLMYADPTDPNIHISISKMLAVEGATAEASRFYNNGIAVLSRAGLLEPRHMVESLALRWLLEGPRVVLQEIDRELRVLRDNARITYERQKEEGILPDRMLTPPEEAFLDPLYEKIRIIAAMDAQDRDALLTGLRELDAYADHQYNEVIEATKLDDRAVRQRALSEFAQTLVSLQFMRALAGVDVEAIRQQIPQIPEIIGTAEWEKLRRPLEAWIALRSRDTATARAILDEIGARDSIMRVCKAELLAAEGDSRGAAAEYETIMRIDPFIPYGAWARSRAMELTGRTDPVTEAGRIMRRLAREVPRSIDTLTTDPSSAMTLTIEPTRMNYGADERVRLSIQLKNISPWPLSVGPNRTISSRILLGVSTDNTDYFASQPQPVVVELDRRFRLLPNEELVAEVEVERGINGLLFDAAKVGVIRQRWQGWQDPQINRMGGFMAGPYSLSDSTVKFARATRDTSRLPAPELVSLVRNAGDGQDTVDAIEAAAARLWRDGRDPGGVVAALTARYADAGPLERLLMVGALPGAAQVPDMAPFDETVRTELSREAVRAVESPRALAALILLTRVRDAEDPLLQAASDTGDDALATAARLLAFRLRENRTTYATVGPGLAALEGASKASALGEDAP